MRLLRLVDNQFTFQDFPGEKKPPYAILSHTWEEDSEEVKFQDVKFNTGGEKRGFRKLYFCGNQAARDGLLYFWVDTCCIDQTNSAELSEAIISMFEWYQKAERCYVYLSDVSSEGRTSARTNEWILAFKRSRWFSRGWTLQELLAPKAVQFFSKEQDLLGDKKSMLQEISDATGISIEAIRAEHHFQFSYEERISWATHRKTTRPEDRAYSLLGLLDVSLIPQYGEGYEKALFRLENYYYSSRCFPVHTIANHAKYRKSSKRASPNTRPDRSSQKRSLCRAYEPLVLLYTLRSREEDYVQAMLPNEEDTLYLPPKLTIRKFLEDLAYLCDYDKGYDTVTAIGMESSLQQNVLWIASNTSPTRGIINFVKARLVDIKQLSATVGTDKSRQVEDFVSTCIDFATPQIIEDMRSLLSGLQTCKSYLEKHRPEEGKSLQDIQPWVRERSA
jgi:hypothetical protein